jgi:hypothetical protein
MLSFILHFFLFYYLWLMLFRTNLIEVIIVDLFIVTVLPDACFHFLFFYNQMISTIWQISLTVGIVIQPEA